jgi:hypothetical protein
MRRITLAAMAAGVALAVAACGSGGAKAPAGAAAPTASPTGLNGQCANGDQLYDVLVADATLWDRLGRTTGLNNPVCAGGFALARAVDSTTGGDPALVLFQLAGGKWKALNGGTADVCGDKVPPDVAKLFAGKGC